MNRTTSILLTSVIGVSMCFSGCGKDSKKADSQKTSDAVNVTVKSVEIQTIDNSVTYTGEIKASESTSVSSKASGLATEIYKEVGDYVNAGDALLKIDETDYRTAYNQAVAAYGQAEAGYKSAKASLSQIQSGITKAEAARDQAKAAYDGAVATYNSVTNGTAEQTKLQLESTLSAAKIEYDNAKLNYDNQKILYENGAVSKSIYDAAVTRYENAKLSYETAQNNYNLSVDVVLKENATNAESGVKSAKAALVSAEAQIESAKSQIDTYKAQIESAQAAMKSAQVGVDAATNNLANTTLRAPISGYIASRNANKGQMVAQGVETFSIKSTSTIDAKINVTEAIIANVTVGTKATVNVKAAGVENIEGVVTSVNTIKDAKTGMYEVSVAIENKEGILKDGMFADITLVIETAFDARTIPEDAVLEDENGTKYVYVVEGDTAKRVDIKTGISSGENVEVVSGLGEKAKVVVSGKEYLSEKNNKIKIVD